MSKLIQAKINLSKIIKEEIFEGKTGKWIDLNIWLNDKEDQYGNTVSIQQSVREGKGPYLGNGKPYVKKEQSEPF